MGKIQHENIVHFEGTLIPPLKLLMEYLPGGDLQATLDLRYQFTLPHPLITDDGAHFEAGETLTLIDPLDFGEGLISSDFVVVEKGRRFRTKSASLEGFKVVKTPTPNRALSWGWRYRVALDVALGMEYLHSQAPSIVHKDLRSPNVCICNRNFSSYSSSSPPVCKILDFGLSELEGTKSRAPLSTWQWAAPETQVVDQPYDKSVDVYSYGILLNELSARKCPFMDDYWDLYCTPDGLDWRSRFACLRNIMDGLRPIIPNSTPKKFKDLIEICWVGEPYLRPNFSQIVARMRELIAELREAPTF